MPRPLPQNPDDPFEGLLLPMDAWKALEDAQITNLKQLKAVAPLIEQIRGMDPATARVIKDRLERLAARRTIRVRLIFSKQSRREPERRRATGSRRPHP